MCPITKNYEYYVYLPVLLALPPPAATAKFFPPSHSPPSYSLMHYETENYYCKDENEIQTIYHRCTQKTSQPKQIAASLVCIRRLVHGVH